MNEESIFDDIEDPEDIRRKELFQSELLLIENRYIDWFKTRPALFEHQEHDKLSNHHTAMCYRGVFKIDFWPDSELPTYIRKEVMDAADRSFR